jgi:glycosidase
VAVTGLDAIRQDTLPYVPRSYWRDWTAALAREFPRVNVVGEVLDGNPALVSFFQGGARRFDGVDSGIPLLFDFPLMFALRNVFTQGRPIDELPRILSHDYLYVDPNRLLTFVGLHDVTRFMGEPGAKAQGLRNALTIAFTVRGIPLLYYGDEIAMPGGNDPDNRRDFPGGWRGDPRDAFAPAGRTPEENAAYEHVRKVAALRRASPALRHGKTLNLFCGSGAWAFARIAKEETVIVAVNTGSQAADLALETNGTGIKDGEVWRDRLAEGGVATAAQGKLTLRIGAHSASVLWKNQN